MAHFAKIENDKVVNVIVVSNEDCAGGDLPDSETAGQAFIASLGLDGTWVQTSYNKSFRGQYAGIGMNWNGAVFYPDAPFASWVLQDDGTWEAPISYPDDGLAYFWDEEAGAWVVIE